MKVDFIDIIMFILFFQLISLFFFLVFQKSNKGISNKILAIFLLVKALCISNFISFRLWDYMYAYFPHSIFFGSSFTILWAPSLYIYIKTLTTANFKFKKKDILHIIPFLGHFIYMTLVYHIYDADAKRQLLDSGTLFPPHYNDFYFIFLQAYSMVYTLFSIFEIRIYRLKVKNSFSAIDSIHLSWMSFILYGFIIKWICDCWYVIAQNNNSGSTYTVLVLSRLILIVFINTIIYKGLKQPVIFLGEIQQLTKKKPVLSKLLRANYLKILLEYMEKEKPYFNPELTFNELSEGVSIPPLLCQKLLIILWIKTFMTLLTVTG